MNILAIDPGTTESGLVLGVLRRRGHEHNTSGMSLRYSSGSCVQCQSENAKNRRSIQGEAMDQKRVQWAKENPEKAAKYLADYRSRNKELLAKKAGAYRRNNLEKFAMRMVEYRRKNPEKFSGYEKSRVRPDGFRQSFNEYRKRWAKENRQKLSEHAHKRSGRKLGRLPAGTIAKIGALQKWRCVSCKTSLKKRGFHKDHAVPLALGGKHTPENIQLLCPPCNLSKAAKHPINFMQSRGFLL